MVGRAQAAWARAARAAPPARPRPKAAHAALRPPPREREHVRVLPILRLLDPLEREPGIEECLQEEPERQVRRADPDADPIGRDPGTSDIAARASVAGMQLRHA